MSEACKKMKRALREGDIAVNHEQDKIQIYGRPHLVYDGECYASDLTEHMTIEFCPFCGQRLAKLWGKE